MASNTRPFRTPSWIAIALALLLAIAHMSPVAAYVARQSVTSHIISGRATNLNMLYPRRAYPGGLPATLSTSILPRDEEGENGMEDEDGEAEPDDGMAADNDEEDESGMEDDGDKAKPDNSVPPQNDEEDSNSDSPNSCASEYAEIEKLTQDIAHCNLYQKPQGDQAIELLVIERDDLLKKLAWMTSERDREHKSFMNEFTTGLDRNDALIAAQKEAFVANKQLERCKYDVDRMRDCPKRNCFFIICI